MGIRASHTAEVVLATAGPRTLSARGKEKLDERMARAREGKNPRCRRQWQRSRRHAARRGSGGPYRACAYEYSLDYAKERKQFGRAIIENQRSPSSWRT